MIAKPRLKICKRSSTWIKQRACDGQGRSPQALDLPASKRFWQKGRAQRVPQAHSAINEDFLPPKRILL